jgi:hypothetical protein
MTLFQELVGIAKENIVNYPALKEQIIDIVNLAKDEIEEGGSPNHEVNLAINDINNIVEEHIETLKTNNK